MRSGPFAFEAAGSLPRPGMAGRIIRGVFGYGALNWVYQLTVHGSPAVLGSLWVLFLTAFAIHLLPYVVNIGFGVRLGFWPRAAGLSALALAAGAGWLISGAWLSDTLWAVVLGLNVYVYFHLGLSFALATIFATPGCEMRALPLLVGRLTGRPARDHRCPGPIGIIDRWEAKRGGRA